MFTLLCIVLTVCIFYKLFVVALKMAWGLTKIIFAVIISPLFLIGLILVGLFYIAVPILVIVGFLTLVSTVDA